MILILWCNWLPNVPELTAAEDHPPYIMIRNEDG